jgi:hypothetical protein
LIFVAISAAILLLIVAATLFFYFFRRARFKAATISSTTSQTDVKVESIQIGCASLDGEYENPISLTDLQLSHMEDLFESIESI